MTGIYGLCQLRMAPVDELLFCFLLNDSSVAHLSLERGARYCARVRLSPTVRHFSWWPSAPVSTRKRHCVSNSLPLAHAALVGQVQCGPEALAEHLQPVLGPQPGTVLLANFHAFTRQKGLGTARSVPRYRLDRQALHRLCDSRIFSRHDGHMFQARPGKLHERTSA